VWLLLLGVFCWVMDPSVSLAKVYRTEATEGDPGDGDESDGGGSPNVPASYPKTTSIQLHGDRAEFYVCLVPIFRDGKVVFLINVDGVERDK
jgi:hypothetical protein